jgi:antitoxin ParD1/3/4
MSVVLPPGRERRIAEKVESGQYDSPAEVVQEALQLLGQRDRLRQLQSEELRREIAIGLDQADRGASAILDVAAIRTESRRRLAEKQAHP